LRTGLERLESGGGPNLSADGFSYMAQFLTPNGETHALVRP
jgi:hypothetical protein